ncbi:hypothetical protein C7271_25870 [filamentous cyanobacterium CCP5]|nr:hypothetical protein C7271_25870 [filamentous cyanobacterium CCP5]
MPDRLASDTLAPWDPSSGHLLLVQGRMLDFDGESQLAGYSGTALFPVAKLDLAEFYRYNAGSTLPPQNCELE